MKKMYIAPLVAVENINDNVILAGSIDNGDNPNTGRAKLYQNRNRIKTQLEEAQLDEELFEEDSKSDGIVWNF